MAKVMGEKCKFWKNDLAIFSFLIVLSVCFISGSCNKELENEPSKTPVNMHVLDWDPDTVVVDSMRIDCDNDAQFDIMFQLEKIQQGTSPSGGPYYNYFAKCKVLNNSFNLAAGRLVELSSNHYRCLKEFDFISAALNWDTSVLLKGEVIAAGYVGIWDLNPSFGYLAIQKTSGNNTYFGWVKLTVDYNPLLEKHYTIRCEKCAFSETANAVVLVGQES